MGKRASFIICAILLALSLTACVKDRLDWKEEIVDYVTVNTDVLLLVCEEWCEKGKANIADLEGTGLPPEVSVDILSGDIVLFEFYAEGLMTASLQGGFYYSREDEVYQKMGLSGEPADWENGWKWQEINGGDNYYITEKICDHFYYYHEGW